jgi:serine/threonine protein kinase
MLRSDYGPLERIGTDSSSVYRGRGNDGTFVALRFLRTDDEGLREQLSHTVHTASAIRHPMLAAVGGCQRFAGDTLCIVSEYVHGQPLDRWIQEHGVPPLRMTVDFVRRLCLGLHAAHQRELTHGALHPGNLMVLQPDTRPGGRIVAKLLDVGVPVWVHAWPPQLTAAQYLAPEVLRTPVRPTTPAILGDVCSDVYACGALLHYLCTGAPPLQSASLPQLMAAANVARPIGRPSYVNPDIPSELEDVIMSALRVDPDERLPNAAELALALGDIETLWSESGVRRRDAADIRRRRLASPDAITPIVNLRGMRHAHGSQPSVELHTPSGLPRGVIEAHTPANHNEREVPAAHAKRRTPARHHETPEAVVPRPHTAPTGTYPKLVWPLRSQRVGYAFVAASAAFAIFVARLALVSSGSHEPELKQLAPVAIALGDLQTTISPSRDRMIEPAIEAQPTITAPAPTGSTARSRGATFVQPLALPQPQEEAPARPERTRTWKRAKEMDLKEDPALAAAAQVDVPLQAAKVEVRDVPERQAEAAAVHAAARPAPAPSSVAQGKIVLAPRTQIDTVLEGLPVKDVDVTQTVPPTASASRTASASAKTRARSAPVRVEIGEIRVRGSLSPSVLRRAIERVRPLLKRCVQDQGQNDDRLRNQVELSATIDEIGRARAPSAWGTAPPSLNECFVAATSKLVAESPDTGTVKVTWIVEY